MIWDERKLRDVVLWDFHGGFVARPRRQRRLPGPDSASLSLSRRPSFPRTTKKHFRTTDPTHGARATGKLSVAILEMVGEFRRETSRQSDGQTAADAAGVDRHRRTMHRVQL